MHSVRFITVPRISGHLDVPSPIHRLCSECAAPAVPRHLHIHGTQPTVYLAVERTPTSQAPGILIKGTCQTDASGFKLMRGSREYWKVDST
jgi:hypothetical protein